MFSQPVKLSFITHTLIAERHTLTRPTRADIVEHLQQFGKLSWTWSSSVYHHLRRTFSTFPIMATSASHPQPFPSRPYTSGLGRTGGQSAFQPTPYNTQTPFNAPAQNTAGLGGAATTQQQRDAQRLERERQERAERERREAEERGVLEALSEEQREEVNEAVCLSYPMPATSEECILLTHDSSRCSIWTKTTTSITTNSKSR